MLVLAGARHATTPLAPRAAAAAAAHSQRTFLPLLAPGSEALCQAAAEQEVSG